MSPNDQSTEKRIEKRNTNASRSMKLQNVPTWMVALFGLTTFTAACNTSGSNTGGGDVGGNSYVGGSNTGGDTGGNSSVGGSNVGGSSNTGGSDTGGGPSDVSGTLMDTFVTAGPDVIAYKDNPLLTLSALVPDAGSFTTYLGTIDASGTFQIPGVPTGEYYLQLAKSGSSTSFIVTSERTLDLGVPRVGRPDTVTITQPTPIALNITGLTAWQDTDTLELFSPESAADGDLVVAGLAPIAGDTSLMGTIDSAQFWRPVLIEGAKGDNAIITHLTSRTGPGTLTYQALGESFAPAPFTQVDGQLTTLNGSFQSATQKQVVLDWKRSQFQAQIAVGNPTATFIDNFVFAYAEPGGKVRATQSLTPTLIVGSDIDMGDAMVALDYGNPFPSTWGEMGYLSVGYRVKLQLPGNMTKSVYGHLTVSGTLESLTAGPIVLTLSPPQNLQIAGKAAYGPLTGVGTTPTIQWSAPATGTPDVYRIDVRQVQAGKPSPYTALIRTKGTSFTFPPGILMTGSDYYVVVTAATGYDETKPLARFGAEITADAVSGLISP